MRYLLTWPAMAPGVGVTLHELREFGLQNGAESRPSCWTKIGSVELPNITLAMGDPVLCQHPADHVSYPTAVVVDLTFIHREDLASDLLFRRRAAIPKQRQQHDWLVYVAWAHLSLDKLGQFFSSHRSPELIARPQRQNRLTEGQLFLFFVTLSVTGL